MMVISSEYYIITNPDKHDLFMIPREILGDTEFSKNIRNAERFPTRKDAEVFLKEHGIKIKLDVLCIRETFQYLPGR